MTTSRLELGNIIEVTWKFDQLVSAGKITQMYMVLIGSEVAKDIIIKIAEDFEQQYPADESKIQEYAEQELIIAFGIQEEKTKIAQKLWQTLGDISIGNNDEILEAWRDFPAGTSRFEIWSWFEEVFNLSVAIDLMHQECDF